MTFSILVVSYNPGNKLLKTITSIQNQTNIDYEIIIKDGNSTDGSLESIEKKENIRIIQSKDKGIYDGMNQAVLEAKGEYILYLNCGDTFYDSHILDKTADYIKQANKKHKIFYGDTYCENNKVLVPMPLSINDFTCYRNIPCHQSCFYRKELFEKHPYLLAYKIRADYEHFLWSYYKGEANPIHMELTISSYEGDGFSEDVENAKQDKKEHKEIIATYMSKKQILKYDMIMCLSLVTIRKWISEKSIFAGVYHKLKTVYYNKR